MSRPKRQLSAEEAELWRRVAKTVKLRRPLAMGGEQVENHLPFAGPVHAVKSPPAPAPTPTPPRPSATEPLADRSTEKRVRRGKLEIGASLDLHGHTQDTAHAALARFLAAAQHRGDRVVIVITGVGRGGEGVLRRRLPDWLGDRTLRGVVSGYAPAHRSHGGAGAFYVFLKRSQRT